MTDNVLQYAFHWLLALQKCQNSFRAGPYVHLSPDGMMISTHLSYNYINLLAV